MELRVPDDITAAAWISRGMTGTVGTVTTIVPSGYRAYARICHPVPDRSGALVDWPTVARRTGRRAHPLMQWHALVGSSDPIKLHGSQWDGEHPQRGHLVPEALNPLCSLLGRHTLAARDCFFCLWDGWGGSSWFAATAQNSLSSARLRSGSNRVHLPRRDYHLLAGPLDVAPQIGVSPAPRSFYLQSPNLMWPADRVWLVATEVDFDSTLVGGSADLIDAVLQSPALDAWAVGPGDSLAAYTDRLNTGT